ncbi:TIGR00725 family protein [Aureivirga sp. CE67]|uniref:TIGR00725 family protein n=1 Tax=Aureivirga sp. CE67 TaxID=1788983 RepID=UPI0018CB860D|nr:TIGR00725 family protein [Aureivirga sp. CE67]
MKNLQIAIIGVNQDLCSKELYDFVYQVGKMLSKYEVNILNGGKGGVMEAVSKGVFENENRKAKVVGILPEKDTKLANDFLDITIRTGLGEMRNSIIISSADLVLAFGGASGTLIELGFCVKYQKKTFCYQNEKGWSQYFSNNKIDERNEGLFIGFSGLEELENLLLKSR